jgi:dTDP-4-amino-4,6-dideoxygalactose transaminase
MPGPGYAFFGTEEWENVKLVLEEWQAGRDAYDKVPEIPVVRRFEAAATKHFAADHCVAVSSGTAALLTALAALDIGPGDEVIVPGYTFIAPIGSVVYSGATPVLAEIDESMTLSPSDVEARITERTKAILAVHMLGAPCDMAALTDIARQHGLLLIEDVAQACGATFAGRHLGTFGDAGAFSLNTFKVITCREGGFVLTNNSPTYQRAYSFHDQGWFPRSGERNTDQGDGDLLFGLNFRMADLAAGIALAQLAKLDRILAMTRTAKRALSDLIPARTGVNRRVLHDADGECATLLVYLFDDATHAQAVCKVLGSRTLYDSGKHNYANMTQLQALGRGDRRVCPFRAPSAASSGGYEPGSLPRTDDILRRAVALSIGVSDSYLGAGCGITVRSSRDDIEKAAERFCNALDSV